MLLKMRFGILSGTFDPIHFGHLRLAESASYELNLDSVIFVPTAISPHKTGVVLTPIEHRYRMVLLAIKNNNKFQINNYEADGNIHYSYDTINYFRQTYPNDELFFIIGSDSLATLHTWKKGYELLDMCKFAVGMRPGDKLQLSENISQKVIFLNTPMLNISAREIRNLLKCKKSVRYLLPNEVIDYINENRIY